MQEKIFDLILNQDDVTWKSLLYDLVKTEQMDPWDVNITLLTQKYVETIKQLKETDLKLSGKVLLAAAVLLKMKTHKLLNEDIEELDRLFASTEETDDDEFFSEFTEDLFTKNQRDLEQKYSLIPRQPQPRTRKVSIHDLVDALQKAMETKKRSLVRQKPLKFEVHLKNRFDIVEGIRDIYARIKYFFQAPKGKNMTFSQLLPPNAQKNDKVFTFIPLLHLENQRKVHTHQPKHFGEIFINLLRKKNNKAK
ncbi:segregation/condensation protein A [Candidatus Woesearchaeota archaeon]|nr:segregation/condensation protein A [Candidatus Woesearchaeota archaeon]